MIDLKFRVWEHNMEEMFYNDQVTVYFDETGAHAGCEYEALSDDDITVMQCTGIKDKNGKDIYQGDIVKHDLTYNPFYKQPFQVKQSKTGEWSMQNYRAGTTLEFSKDRVEVVGNVFETPDLHEECWDDR